jgi:hypothetical protein
LNTNNVRVRFSPARLAEEIAREGREGAITERLRREARALLTAIAGAR